MTYLETELTKLGAETTRCPFEISHFREIDSEVRLLSPYYRKIECRANYRSASTPESGLVSDKVVEVGQGTEEDLRDRDLNGAIVLTQDGRVHLPNLLDNVHRRGAVACIMVRHRPDNLISTQGLQRHGSPIPSASIGYHDGQMLRALVSKGPVRVFLKVKTCLKRATADNLLGTLKGRD